MATCRQSLRRAGSVLFFAAGVLGLLASPARAEDKAAAQVLFDEGRRLMKAGHYDEACPKFEAARRLYVGPGILLNLGDCHEHLGRTATAWADFGEAAEAARRAGRADDADEARRRLDTLAPRLGRILLRVAQDAPGLIVRCDGKALDRARLGTAFPVDPGDHLIEAGAYRVTIHAGEPGAVTTVDVPASAIGAASPVAPRVEAPPPAEAAPPYWTVRRAVGVGLAGAGVLGLGAGGVLGLLAKAKDQRAANEHGAARHDDSVAAVQEGNVATAVVVVGAAVAVAGATIWLTAPKGTIAVGTDGRRLLVQGRF